MAKRIVDEEDPELMREQLNMILRKMSDDISMLKGEKGEISQAARMKHSDDIIIDSPRKGIVLKDDGNPPRYWRVYIDHTDTSNSPKIETMNPNE